MVGVQWSQFEHAMLHHSVAGDERANHHRPPNMVHGKNLLKSAEPLSEVMQKGARP